ncbi:ATP-dependent helicase [Butyrivibrio sp. AE2032]|uniref:ATP-dependent helicase n=1 Tax=Butyrivibrio sp. AE2032 TaxID=1458463 RepID=UPI00068A3E6B|nr:UvrD-helicase domain-containing protein [Butyrivibrio sp. AE2032]
MTDGVFNNSDDFFRDMESIYGQGEEMLSDPDADRLLEGLNAEQKAAVTHLNGPLLILAGAGSGKTRVITYRIAYMIRKHNVAPSSILAITFTNKAANEMRQRIEALIGDRSKFIWCGTFHSIFARILRRHAELLGYTKNFSIIDTDDQAKLIKDSMKELDIADSQFKPRSIQNEISNAKNQFHDTEEYSILAGKDYFQSVVARVYKRYQEKLLANNAMDFDDILVNMVKLLENNPDIRELYRNKFNYIMVDEYQDTNMPQYRAVMQLAQGSGNICVVGDDDQSIYSFRGADVRLILKFEKDFPGSQVIKLEENYRSTKTILNAANCVIANNKKRKSKHLRTEGAEGDKIIVMNADTGNGEADFVARTIKMMADKGKFKYSDCAVLYRMNALSRNIETSLHNMGIPFRVYGGMRFYDRKEIKDILAYLKLINDTNDNIAFERIINVPKRGIGDATIEKIRQYAMSGDTSMFDVAMHAVDYPELVRSASKICSFTDLINSMREKLVEGELDFAQFVDYVENESGIIEEITEQREKKGEIIDRVENLKELLSEAAEYDKAHRAEPVDMDTLEIDDGDGLPVEVDDDFFFDTATSDTTEGILGLYLENASLFTEGDDYNDNDDYVKLMTIHSAKGLEFGAVFIIGMEEGVFPSYRSIQSIEDTEEERRLMYVAITRAKKNLFIVLSKQRMLFGQTNCNQPSRFIREINPELLYLMGSKREAPKDVPEGKTNREKSRQSIASAIKSQFTAEKANARREDALSPSDLFEGMKVIHPRFGEGVILKVEPVGGDALITVDFDGMRKNMLANSAGLKKG